MQAELGCRTNPSPLRSAIVLNSLASPISDALIVMVDQRRLDLAGIHLIEIELTIHDVPHRLDRASHGRQQILRNRVVQPLRQRIGKEGQRRQRLPQVMVGGSRHPDRTRAIVSAAASAVFSGSRLRPRRVRAAPCSTRASWRPCRVRPAAVPPGRRTGARAIRRDQPAFLLEDLPRRRPSASPQELPRSSGWISPGQPSTSMSSLGARRSRTSRCCSIPGVRQGSRSRDAWGRRVR